MRSKSAATAIPPTLKDLSGATGFSVASVSYALRGEGSLSEASRAAILRAAADMGYRPNLHAAQLRSMRRDGRAIGYPIALLLWNAPGGVTYPIDPTAEAVKRTASERGFQLHLASFTKVAELRHLLRVLFHRGVRGLVMSGAVGLESSPEIDFSPFSIVTCGRWETPPVFHNVREDVFSSVASLVTDLVRRGFRRIGAALCRHDAVVLDDVEREGAWLSFLNRIQKSQRVPAFPHQNTAAFLEWFRQWRPDALIGFSDAHYFTLRKAGVRIPRDVAYVSLQATAHPALIAGLTDTHPMIGSSSLGLLESLIRHNDAGIPLQQQTLLLRGKIQSGKSLPASAHRPRKSAPAGT